MSRTQREHPSLIAVTKCLTEATMSDQEVTCDPLEDILIVNNME